MKVPKVSIYITNYNYGKYIKKSIESVLNQSFQDFELFIIDDGSTDNSKEIIEEYNRHPKIQIIYQKNKGLNITNNIALRVAKGDYIMRLDADDYLATNAISVMTEKLNSDENLGLVFPDYFLIDENGEKIGEVIRLDFQKEVVLLDQPAHGACTMIRKKFLLALGGYDENYKCQDGYELWIKFIRQYKVANINKFLFSYRQHGNNLTSNENRILDTRYQIKDNYISNNNIKIPKTLIVIPIRRTLVKGNDLAYLKIDGLTILDRVVKTACKSKAACIVLTSSHDEYFNYFEENFCGKAEFEKVKFVRRPTKFERINESLIKTIDYILDYVSSETVFDAVMTMAIEFPYISTFNINDAINTLVIFDSDSLISVRQDNNMYFRHDGGGLKPILGQEMYTKLERESLYKYCGGLTIAKINEFRKAGKMLCGKVGHIVINSTESYEVSSLNDVKLLNHVLKARENE